MSVQELIDELMKIDDKTLRITLGSYHHNLYRLSKEYIAFDEENEYSETVVNLD